MTDPVLISIVGAVATVITSTISAIASIKNHKAITRVEKATNGLMRQRDAATKTKAHRAGMRAQRNKDLK